MNRQTSYLSVLLAAACLVALPLAAYANVYPSGMNKDDGSFNTTCGTAKITYILNEDADGTSLAPGVKLEVLNASQAVVRTVTFPVQKKGSHTWEWDGRKDDGSRAPNGNYTIKVTASDFGYTAWTMISDETTINTTHFERPRGVAVNTNPLSSKYGKVYVTQATPLSTGSGRAMQDGVYVLNADQSDAGFFTGGVDWTLDNTGTTPSYSSPMKCIVGPDDHLYVIYYYTDTPYEFNDDMSTATALLDSSNKTTSQYVYSIWVEGTQAAGNRKIYTVDSNYYAGAKGRKGLIKYDLGANAAATPGDTGTQWIGPDYYTYYPRDVARDSQGNWYINQYRASPGQAFVISKFADPGETPPNNTALWEASKDYSYAAGIALWEPKSWVVYGREGNGTVYFFDMATGAFLNSVVCGRTASGTASGNINDVVFDAAGNMYTVDNVRERMRVWSPPDGANSKSLVSGTVALNKTGTGGPAITAQPQDASVCSGGSATFAATATGAGLTYQWQKNGADLTDDGTNIIGATTAGLTLNNIPASDGGAAITVKVCGTDGVVISKPAVIKVGISFPQPPLSQNSCVNGNATFAFVAQGKGELAYQWQRYVDTAWVDLADDGMKIAGATTNALTISGIIDTDNNAKFRCAVRDDCCRAPADPVYTAEATLTFGTGPALSHVGYGGTIAAGGSITMTCYATGSGVLKYQWKKNGTPVEGATTGSITIKNATCNDTGVYSCEVTDDCGTKERSTDLLGNPAQVTVTATEICDNGIDDTCDGLTDCDDPACATDPACLCKHHPWADSDDDADVDQVDFGAWQLCYTGPGDVYQQYNRDLCGCFDRNLDNAVDMTDFTLFQSCFSGANVPADVNCGQE